MCTDRKLYRTFMDWEGTGHSNENGWCEEITPGLYRSTVHHLGDCVSMVLDEKTLKENPDARLDEGIERRLLWGCIFQGRADGHQVHPEMIVGIDLSPCNDCTGDEEEVA